MVQLSSSEPQEPDVAFDWVRNWVVGLLAAIVTGEVAEARRATHPDFAAEGLEGLGVDPAVMQRTTALCGEAQRCLNAQPIDTDGARKAVLRVAKLWSMV